MFKVTRIDGNGNAQQSFDAKDEAHAERIAQRMRASFPVGSSNQARITKTR